MPASMAISPSEPRHYKSVEPKLSFNPAVSFLIPHPYQLAGVCYSVRVTVADDRPAFHNVVSARPQVSAVAIALGLGV